MTDLLQRIIDQNAKLYRLIEALRGMQSKDAGHELSRAEQINNHSKDMSYKETTTTPNSRQFRTGTTTNTAT